jgi:predicted nucleic acid-binding Zn ribbon protein
MTKRLGSPNEEFSKMEGIAKLLPLMVKAGGGQEDVLEGACFAAWTIAVGGATARFSRPVSLSGKTLTVAASDAQWRKQLEALAGQILFKLNATLGQPTVTRIHVIVDAKFVKLQHPSAPKPPKLKPAAVDPEIVAGANEIADPKLREQFLRTVARCVERQSDNHPSTK